MPLPKITPVDAELLSLLQKNARISNKALAEAAGIAESTCLDRVRSLQERGVISGFHADVDLQSVGRSVRALISVRLQPKTTESVLEFQEVVLAAPETIAIWTVTGADDFVVEVAVSNVEGLRTFVLDVITTRHDVADSRTALVYDYRSKAVVTPVPE
jgi:DNA-binding Lrp family transcriptional regulator